MSRVPPDENYQPPPRPDPVMGPALTVNQAALERRAMYRQLAAECEARAGTEASSQADYIGRTYGLDRDGTR